MNPGEKRLCLAVTTTLMTYPCAVSFVQTVDDEIGLETIVARLHADEYKTVEAWDSDVALLWYNAEKFSGHNSFIFLLAKEVEKHYRKLRRQLDRVDGWTRRWVKLEKKMNDLMGKAPAKARKVAPKVEKREEVVLDDSESRRLLKATRFLTKSADILFLNNVMMMFTNIDMQMESVNMDLRDLPPAASRAIRDYAMKRLGSNYPE